MAIRRKHYEEPAPQTVADVEGPWRECDFTSSLIERCKRGWNTPVGELSNEILATYLRQKVGLSLVVPEAERRIDLGIVDDTECYDEELEEALQAARKAV